MELGLYPQVFMLRRKYFKITESKTNEAKLKFQRQSARPRSWFDIDLDWIQKNFITREPDLYRKIHQRNEKTQDKNTFKMFEVPIGNSKCAEK